LLHGAPEDGDGESDGGGDSADEDRVFRGYGGTFLEHKLTKKTSKILHGGHRFNCWLHLLVLNDFSALPDNTLIFRKKGTNNFRTPLEGFFSVVSPRFGRFNAWNKSNSSVTCEIRQANIFTPLYPPVNGGKVPSPFTGRARAESGFEGNVPTDGFSFKFSRG
jgi:hypothetical protein